MKVKRYTLHEYGLVILLLVMLPAGLRSGTVSTVTCDNGSQNQQVSDPQNAACNLAGQQGMVAGSSTVSVGSVSVWTSASSDFAYPFAMASASWDVVFPVAEMLTWQISWGYGANYSMSLSMGGQHPPLYQWISERLNDATWSQTVAAGEYIITASSQDYGEGDASLCANLGDPTPVPEPGTWMGALAGFGLLAAARRLTVKIRWERPKSSRAKHPPAGCSPDSQGRLRSAA
jgi:hypothetical protein